MQSVREDVTPDAVVRILMAATAKGVTLWSESGQLRYRAPKGALSAVEMDRLRAFKEPLVQLLESNAQGGKSLPPLGARPTGHLAPLTFSQAAHWRLYRLDSQPAIRQIAAAVHLTGDIDTPALNAAITEVIRRHEALRSRLVIQDDEPVQQVLPPSPYAVEEIDLSQIPTAQQEEAVRSCLDGFILEPVDVTVGPLFGARLLQLQAAEHVLLVVMEHLISDAASLGIFLHELFICYDAFANRQLPTLPPVAVQLGDYAHWQRSCYPEWKSSFAGALAERLLHQGRLRFPATATDDARRGWGAVPVRIDRELKAKVTHWAKANNCTMPAIAFAVYSCLVLRWCNASETVVRYQSDGRLQPAVQNTIGYLASVLYLPVQLSPTDSWSSVIRRTAAEYLPAYQQADFSDLAARAQPPEVTKNTSFNWVPWQGSNSGTFTSGSLACTQLDFEHPMLESLAIDGEPSMLLYERPDDISGYLYYPRNRFRTEDMERFAQAYIAFMQMQTTESRVPCLRAPSGSFDR